ncbi:MAG: type II toxin-antitoxin system VapC family toxin [Terriglobia bacterium]
MNYILDTNACVALINGKPPSVRSRFERAIAGDSKVFVPSIVSFELWYGAAKSSRPEVNRQRLQTFFAGPIMSLAFEDEDAQAAGAIRADLEVAGKPIGAYDLLIAGQALRHKSVLVTANIAEFRRIKGLIWQDWGRPS